MSPAGSGGHEQSPAGSGGHEQSLAGSGGRQHSSGTVVIDSRCTACGMCLATCPTRALLAAPRRPVVVDILCIACGACVEVCPTDAIRELALP